MSDAQDVDGKFFVKERVELATKQPSFWQDYKFVNPVDKKVEPKQMYCERLDNTAVCAGIYKTDKRQSLFADGSLHRRIDMLSWIKNIGLSWKVLLAPAFLILVLSASAPTPCKPCDPTRPRSTRLLRGRSGNRNL